jgi:hypothetical protein
MAETYIFFRRGTFYPITLRDDDDARRNAECNPGTLKVENVDGSRLIWEASDESREPPN